MNLKLIGIVLALIGTAESQTAVPQQGPRFEVASIKPHKAADTSVSVPTFLPGGKFIAVGIPLQTVIAFAYNVPSRGAQLSGGPDWIRSLEYIFDIEAHADESAMKGLDDSQAREVKLRLMLQALLADRFSLRVRHEMKQEPVYALIVAKNGPKLQKSTIEATDCDGPGHPCHNGGVGQGHGIHVKAFTIGELILALSNFTDRPMVDRTGLKELYDIDTGPWVPMRPRPIRPPGIILTPGQRTEDLAFADPTLPTLFMRFEQLGLKMEPSTASEDVLTIEHIEKPTEN